MTGPEEGFEPDLLIDEQEQTFEAFGGNYDQVIADVKEAAGEGQTDAPAEQAADEPPAADEFVPQSSDENWTEKAGEYKQVLGVFGETPDIVKTEEDYVALQNRFKYVNEKFTNDQEVLEYRTRIDLDDHRLIEAIVKERSNVWDTDADIEERTLKMFDEKGDLTDKAKGVVESVRSDLQRRADARLLAINAEAVAYAKEQTKFRSDVVNEVKSLVVPELTFSVDDNEVKLPTIKLPAEIKAAIHRFSTTPQYEERLHSEKVNRGEGYKIKVENSLWSNPVSREWLIKEIGKEAYKKGQSDYIAKNVINK